jgi:hypothetical protein
MRTKFLWIEDNAATDMRYLLGPIFSDGRFEAVIALNVADGLQRLMEREYTAIVVDVRLPPGNDPQWSKLYNDYGKNKGAARLGLELIKTLLNAPDCQIKLPRRATWLKSEQLPGRFGVLTVDHEPEVLSTLAALKLKPEHIKQKTVRTPARTLLDIVAKITDQAR